MVVSKLLCCLQNPTLYRTPWSSAGQVQDTSSVRDLISHLQWQIGDHRFRRCFWGDLILFYFLSLLHLCRNKSGIYNSMGRRGTGLPFKGLSAIVYIAFKSSFMYLYGLVSQFRMEDFQGFYVHLPWKQHSPYQQNIASSWIYAPGCKLHTTSQFKPESFVLHKHLQVLLNAHSTAQR